MKLDRAAKAAGIDREMARIEKVDLGLRHIPAKGFT
jgi:hypothetical protein